MVMPHIHLITKFLSLKRTSILLKIPSLLLIIYGASIKCVRRFGRRGSLKKRTSAYKGRECVQDSEYVRGLTIILKNYSKNLICMFKKSNEFLECKKSIFCFFADIAHWKKKECERSLFKLFFYLLPCRLIGR